jgi:hypothetical protein
LPESQVGSSDISPFSVRINFNDILLTRKEKNVACPFIKANNINRKIELGKPAV